MGISTTLPEADIEQILAVVRARTDEQIISVTDGEFGPEVKTGRLYGHVWVIRRASAGWKIMQGLQWAT
jgi:hypothetical protein